ncbi:cysteine-rich secretory protein 1-like [Rhynchonycteris naso]
MVPREDTERQFHALLFVLSCSDEDQDDSRGVGLIVSSTVREGRSASAEQSAQVSLGTSERGADSFLAHLTLSTAFSKQSCCVGRQPYGLPSTGSECSLGAATQCLDWTKLRYELNHGTRILTTGLFPGPMKIRLNFFLGITMKYFLFLAVAACFLPALLVRVCEAKLPVVPYDKVQTGSKSVQAEIVDFHNILRRGVLPTASNMLKMSWSEEAARNTKMLTKYCDLVMSNPLKRRITNTFCGENLYLTSYLISWSNVIKIWYNESKYFKYGQWTPMNEDKTVDHYIQVVWATSYLIGCSVSPCCKRKSPEYLYICHYCHEGNEPDKKSEPYKQGKPCEDCPNNCEDKLCTNPCIYYDEYIDCKSQKNVLGCNHSAVQLRCKATCSCVTEIT